MSIISISKTANPNYLAKVIKVKGLRKHPNADRLSVFTVDGNDIITSTDTPEDQVSIYFPLECQISHEYLSKGNDYRKSLGLNADPEAPGGFFEEKGRVKAVKLRSQKSEGYVVPISSLSVLMSEDKWRQLEQRVGEEFDTVDGQLLIWKYVVPRKNGVQGEGKERPKRKFESRLIDNQFKLHYDTSQLGKNIHKIKPDDIISISWKLHGTSFVSSKVLCKRKLTWYERIAKFFGVRVVDTEYANIYSSRKVVKNEDINKTPQHYYKYDLWGEINNAFKDQLLEGESIYGECVGYTKDGEAIQKHYDYGCSEKQHEIYVYRITHTNVSGKVIDLPMNMVQERCVQLGVKYVPEIFFGRAKDFFNYAGQDISQWQEWLVSNLKTQYVHDQDCQFCTNRVPSEGIVLRIEGLKPEALKLKNFRFLESETKLLDKGETNLEDDQSTEEA